MKWAIVRYTGLIFIGGFSTFPYWLALNEDFGLPIVPPHEHFFRLLLKKLILNPFFIHSLQYPMIYVPYTL